MITYIRRLRVTVMIYLCRYCSLIYDWTRDGQNMAGSVLSWWMAAWTLEGGKRKGKTLTGDYSTGVMVSLPTGRAHRQVNWC